MIDPRLIVDASVVGAWAYEDEATPWTETLRDVVKLSGAVVPAIWPIEIQNLLRVGERQGRISPAGVDRFILFLRSQIIEVDPLQFPAQLGDLLAVARQHNLTAYDAGYIELARRRGLRLATLDRRIQQAARSVGIDLIDAG